MFDQLAVLSPIMMALSAATPIHRGMLADTDVRWKTISASVDDRTEEEMRPPDSGISTTNGEDEQGEAGWFGLPGEAGVGVPELVVGDAGVVRRQPKSRYGGGGGHYTLKMKGGI